MNETRQFVRKLFLQLSLLGIGVIVIMALLSGQMLLQGTLAGVGVIALGCANFLAMKHIDRLIQARISKTERILEETHAHELQEYTKKLEAETKKLQETSDFLHSILDSSTEYSIITTGKDGKLTLFNKGAERIIGYPAEEVVGKETPLLFLRGSSSKSFAQVGVQILKYGVDESEWEVIRKDGQSLTVLFTMTPMRNRDGAMLGFLGIAKDVTAQKKLERQLQDYTENLEKIVEKRTEELAKKNMELDDERRTAEHRAQELGMINTLSQAISSTIELEEVLAIGAKQVVELLHVTQSRLFLIKEGTDQLESVYKYDKTTQRGELNNVSAPLSRYPDFLKAIHTGKPVIVEDVQTSDMAPEVKRVFEKQGVFSIINLPLMSKDSAIGIMMLLQTGECRHFTTEEMNLAETVASQLAVALKNAQLFHHVVEEKGRIEALVNSSGDGILMTDNKFHIILTNAIVNELFQTDAAQYHEKHLMEFIDAQKDNLKEFDLVKQISYKIITTPQDTVTEEVNVISPPKTLKIIGNPVLGEKKVIGHMIVLHDITQEKQLERMRDDLVSMIVHDLKNPLAGIIGFSEIMLGKMKKQGIEEFDRFLTGILYQANTMHEMVNNILEVHKMEDGSMEIQRDVAAVEDMVNNAIRQVEVSAKQREIVIQSELPDNLPFVFVDQTKIVRVCANILSNAIKYTPQQGKITVHAKRQGEELLMSIADTGKGIPTQYLEHIFERFAQVDRKREGKAASVGLGLYFCKLVIQAHGGKIWAESEIGKGSAFYFTIPDILFGEKEEEGTITI